MASLSTILFGTAAVGTVGTAGFVAGGTGLIGVGGSFSAAATATTVGLTTAAVGGVSVGLQAAEQADAQASIAEFNARVEKNEAKARDIRTGVAARREEERAIRRQSTLLANLGGSGAVIDVGAPLLLQIEQVRQDETEKLAIIEAGQTGSEQSRNRAFLDQSQADLFRSKAAGQRRGALVGGASTLLAGFGQIRSSRTF